MIFRLVVPFSNGMASQFANVQLGYQHFFHPFFEVLGVKVRSISCNIGPAERAISRNMDRSRMSGIGKLHDDGHVPCNKPY